MPDEGDTPNRDVYPSDDEDDGEGRRLFEGALPEVLRRLVEGAVEKGVDAITEGPENLRSLLAEMRMPKEAAGYVYQQIDDTKKGVYRVVAKEIRDVLEHTNFANEIAQVLTKLSFEINTTIRFVPNEDDNESDEPEEADRPQKKRTSKIPRPKVVSKVVMKARDTLASFDPRTEDS